MAFAPLYKDVNLTWPASKDIPKMTQVEAIRAAKRLWRMATGKAWPGTWKAGRGNHRTYPRRLVFLVNPGQGWKRMVHDLSHIAYDFLTAQRGSRVEKFTSDKYGRYIFDSELKNVGIVYYNKCVVSAKKAADYRYAPKRPHSDDHSMLEKQMIKMVIERGWLDGTLKV